MGIQHNKHTGAHMASTVISAQRQTQSLAITPHTQSLATIRAKIQSEQRPILQYDTDGRSAILRDPVQHHMAL